MKSVLLASLAAVSIFAAFILAVPGNRSSVVAYQEKDSSAKSRKVPANRKKEVATLAGGCFWCLEAVYNDLRGVEKLISGYSGGRVIRPTYEQVSAGNTGHAEVVQITFDPQVISFKELLEVFFTIHDPTTLNRQGADVGAQYRSAIFYHSPEQKAEAEKVIADIAAAKIWKNSIVTEVTKFEAFYPAEDYHQRYYERNPNQGYCRMVIEPKVIKFRRQFMSKLKKQPAANER
ncbi:MAG: Peptide methionine sulfoxide reductase MsrA [Acidobacteria bacterium]|nr:Peptide methionine sulfoxide reductase MsrA [Acidobacteriota bacterium]